MNVQLRTPDITSDATNLDREARRILRRLCEPGACLAVATEMDKAVVVRNPQMGARPEPQLPTAPLLRLWR